MARKRRSVPAGSDAVDAQLEEAARTLVEATLPIYFSSDVFQQILGPLAEHSDDSADQARFVKQLSKVIGVSARETARTHLSKLLPQTSKDPNGNVADQYKPRHSADVVRSIAAEGEDRQASKSHEGFYDGAAKVVGQTVPTFDSVDSAPATSAIFIADYPEGTTNDRIREIFRKYEGFKHVYTYDNGIKGVTGRCAVIKFANIDSARSVLRHKSTARVDGRFVAFGFADMKKSNSTPRATVRKQSPDPNASSPPSSGSVSDIALPSRRSSRVISPKKRARSPGRQPFPATDRAKRRKTPAESLVSVDIPTPSRSQTKHTDSSARKTSKRQYETNIIVPISSDIEVVAQARSPSAHVSSFTDSNDLEFRPSSADSKSSVNSPQRSASETSSKYPSRGPPLRYLARRTSEPRRSLRLEDKTTHVPIGDGVTSEAPSSIGSTTSV